jgi:hypothetical protein
VETSPISAEPQTGTGAFRIILIPFPCGRRLSRRYRNSEFSTALHVEDQEGKRVRRIDAFAQSAHTLAHDRLR